jgi:glycosyltransferase involved in cell wall biosynthesis
LLQQAVDAGLPSDMITVTNSLGEAEFAALWRTVSMIILPSAFEGFGLPVLEGLARGIPVVTSADPALLEVGAGHTYVARVDTASAYADQVKRAVTEWSPERARVWRSHALGHRWERTVARAREALMELT